MNAPGYFKVLHIALKYQKEKLASPFLSIAFINLTAKVSFNCASCEKLLDKANKEKYSAGEDIARNILKLRFKTLKSFQDIYTTF